MRRTLLLLSGGVESTALACWRPPNASLTLNYGQASATGEIQSAAAIALRLGIPHSVLTVDCREVGAGLMCGQAEAPGSPSTEWWPYRNQLLGTLAAAWALQQGYDEVQFGAVRDDDSHVDGTSGFYSKLDALVQMQEGGLRVTAPAIKMTSAQLLDSSRVPNNILALTLSCHAGPVACGTCPGCMKRHQLLEHRFASA